MGLSNTRERAAREAASYVDGMTGIPAEFYQQGFEAGFRVGYAAAEKDRNATSDFDASAFRRERVRREVSLHEMERRTGWSPVVVSAIERGEAPVNDEVAGMLWSALREGD